MGGDSQRFYRGVEQAVVSLPRQFRDETALAKLAYTRADGLWANVVQGGRAFLRKTNAVPTGVNTSINDVYHELFGSC